MVKAMAMVGSSMWMGGSGAGVSALVTVSPMVMPSTPAMARMSPGTPDGFVHPLESLERIELGDAGGVHRAIALGDGHRVPVAQGSVEHAANSQAAQVIAVVQVGNQHLE